MSDKIDCPKCGHSFAPTEEAARKIKAGLEKEFESRLDKERDRLVQNERERVMKENSIFMSDLKSQLQEREAKLLEAEKNELALRKVKRELESEKKEFEISVARKIDDERSRIQAEAEEKLSIVYHLKEKELNKRHEDMAKQIEELRRKSEQGSQQAQGEVFELEIESALHEAFRYDDIEPVAKGVKGGDILQRVGGNGIPTRGTILYELKRTKAWSDGWIAKLKDDQRAAKADVAVIISTVLPKDVKHIGQVDGVWVCDFQSALGLAAALRSTILEVAQARNALVGRKDKMENLYTYLSGPEFRGRIEAIVESFVTMKEDLEAEKRAFEKIWAKRDKQILRVSQHVSGMHGDLGGIIGSALPEIKQLELSVV